MSPVLGQGLLAGLEDVAVFADCLQQHHGNLDTALPAYNRQRLPDVQAIMTVNEVVASSDVGLSSQVQRAYPPSLPCMLAFPLPVALLACLSACLPACLSACHPACLSACLCPCLLA